MKNVQDSAEPFPQQLLNELERVLYRIAPRAAHSPPPDEVRHQIVDTLGLWQFCADSACQRDGCCRGEPLQCLFACLPRLPVATIDQLMRKHARKPSRKRKPASISRRRAQPTSVSLRCSR